MGYIAGALCGGLSFLKKDSKLVYFITFLFAWILFGFNTMNLDYLNYKARYEGAGGLISEPLFLYTLKVFSRLGLTYQQFLLIFSLAGLLLMSAAILTYSPFPALVLFFYILFPFCLDTVQIRFFMASALILFSAFFLLKFQTAPKFRFILLYFLFMAAAVGMHYSALFFIPFCVLFLRRERASFFLYILVPAGIIVIPVMLPFLSEIFSSFISMQKVNSWLRGGSPATLTRLIRLIVCRGGILFLIILASRMPQFDDAEGEDAKNRERIDSTLFLLALYCLLFTSFEIFLGREYERLCRPAFVFAWIYITRKMSHCEASVRLIMWVLCLGVILVNFYSILFLGTAVGGDRMFDTVFLNMFKMNAVL